MRVERSFEQTRLRLRRAPARTSSTGTPNAAAVSSTVCGLIEDVLAGEFAVRIVSHVAAFGARRSDRQNHSRAGAGQRRDLLGGPDVERAFALESGCSGIDDAVGVFGGVEAAFRVAHVAQHVVEDAARDVGVLRRRR